MKNNEPNPIIKPKFIIIAQHHQHNPIIQIHQTWEKTQIQHKLIA